MKKENKKKTTTENKITNDANERKITDSYILLFLECDFELIYSSSHRTNIQQINKQTAVREAERKRDK